MSKKFEHLGTVSHATMLLEDLIPTFMEVLNILDSKKHDEFYQDPENEKPLEWVYGQLQLTDEDEAHIREQAGHLLDELFDALGEFAPPYCYFGAHEGDGSDYGFWISQDAIDDALRDGELLKIDDLGKILSWEKLKGHWDYVLHVNDHGNMTLYDMDENVIWAVV